MNLFDYARFFLSSDGRFDVLKKEINRNIIEFGRVDDIFILNRHDLMIQGILGVDKETINITITLNNVQFYTEHGLKVTFKKFNITPSWLNNLVNLRLKENAIHIPEVHRPTFIKVKKIIEEQFNELPESTTNTESSTEFSDENFWNKLKKGFKAASNEVLEKALTLYYCFLDKDTPAWAKTTIIPALGYFISPVDVVPDYIPVAGYSDDLSVILGAMYVVASHIKEEHKIKAKEKANSIIAKEKKD